MDPVFRLARRGFVAFSVSTVLAGCAAAGEAEAPASPAPGVVAVVAGKAITEGQLQELAKDRLASLKTMEYRIKRQVLEEYITRTLLEAEAKVRGITVEELEKREIGDKLEPVTEEQKRSAYGASGDDLEGASETTGLARAEANLKRRRSMEARRTLVDQLRTKAGVQVFLAAPEAAVGGAASRVTLAAEAGFSKGPATAPVTLVEFSDFQCPACSRANPLIKRIQEAYGSKVRVVFRDFPLTMHRSAAKAAEAGRCAGEQGKFWEMNELLFANQAALQVPDLKRRAAELHLDQARFDACLDSGRQSASIAKDVEEGRRVGVTGTPTFFVNGRRVGGARSYEAFAKVIDEELQSGGTAVSQELGSKK